MYNDQSTNNRKGAVLIGIIVAVLILFGVLGHHSRSRHKHHAKLVKTKSHRIYAENDDGSCYAFDGGGGADIDLPRAGSDSFRLPNGTWVRSNPPREDEIEEEEDSVVEESDAGQPVSDADGDIGADSDGADSGGDSGGDGGGDGGGGDGGGGDGG